MIRGSDSSDGILTCTRPTFTAKNNWEGWIKYEPPPQKKHLLENPRELSRIKKTRSLEKGNKEISQIFVSAFPFKLFADL